MTKNIASKTIIVIMTIVAVIFSGQSIFQSAVAQTGAAGSHDEIVKRLQGKLAAINNEALTSEMTPILSGSSEADLGTKLVDAFLASVEKVNKIASECTPPGDYQPEKVDALMKAAENMAAFWNEIDGKAELIQAYYDALAPEKQTAWGRTASAKMTNGSKATVEKLKSLTLVRPANLITQHCGSCFVTYEKANSELHSNRILVQLLDEMATILAKKSQPSDSDYYEESSYDEYASSEDTPKKPEKLPELSLIEQAESLVMGTATVEQVMPLCQLLADSMDNQMEIKRYERAKVDQRPGPSGATNASPSDSDEYSSTSDSSYDDPYASPSSRRSAAMPTPQVNAARLLNIRVCYFMARTLKPMVLAADDKNKITLFKAWCALGEGGAFTDPLPIFMSLQSSSNASTAKPSSDTDTAPSSPNNAAGDLSSCKELCSLLSDYQADYRTIVLAFHALVDNPALSRQMCFNLGGTIIPLAKQGLSNPNAASATKVALIEAVQYTGEPDAAGFLIPLLLSNDPNVVRAAADAIGTVGDRRAAVTLLKGLNNPRLADTIVGILKKLGHHSQNDIILMFKQGKPEIDRFCIDILCDGGDINALPALVAVMQRYHSSPSMKDLPQAEKSAMLMLAMQAGTAIAARNANKVPPALNVPTLATDGESTHLNYEAASKAAAGQPGTSSSSSDSDDSNTAYETDSSDSSSRSSGSDGEGGSNESAVVPLDRLNMPLADVENNGPCAWLEIVYAVTTRHLADSAKLMENVRSVNSAQKIGMDMRNERVYREFFRTVINSSEENLSAYLTSPRDIRKLKDQKERVAQSLGVYKRQENRIKERSSAAFEIFSKTVDPDASPISAGGTGEGGTPRQPVNPLGRRL